MQADSCPAASVQNGACCHAGRMEGRKEVLWSQAFSKRKKNAFGTLVDIVSSNGVWSHVGRGREVRVDDGKARLWSWLAKARSRRARTGFCCMLDQV